MADLDVWSAYSRGQQAGLAPQLAGMQLATGAVGLAQHLQEMQSQQAMRDVLSQSGGDPEKAMAALLQTGNIAAAHKLAPVLEVATKMKQQKLLQGLDMSDPAALERAGMALGKPEFITHAERLRTNRNNQETLGLMQGAPAQPAGVAPIDELGGGPAQPATEAKPGAFSSLMQSKYPEIATEAKNLQARLDRMGNNPEAVKYFQAQQSALAARESTRANAEATRDAAANRQQISIDNRPAPQEPLVPVKGPDGNVIYMPRSQAAGMQVGARTTDQNVSKQTQALGTALNKAGMSTTDMVVGNAEAAVAKPEILQYLTGVGTLRPDIASSKEVTDARQSISKLFNIELKDRSGAAVTNQELQRLKSEYGSGLFKKPEQLQTAVARAREIVDAHYRSIAAGFGPEALKSYNENLTNMGGKPVLKGGAAGEWKDL